MSQNSTKPIPHSKNISETILAPTRNVRQTNTNKAITIRHSTANCLGSKHLFIEIVFIATRSLEARQMNINHTARDKHTHTQTWKEKVCEVRFPSEFRHWMYDPLLETFQERSSFPAQYRAVDTSAPKQRPHTAINTVMTNWTQFPSQLRLAGPLPGSRVSFVSWEPGLRNLRRTTCLTGEMNR